MGKPTILKLANKSMLTTFILFLSATVLAYGYESQLPIVMLIILHISQILLAGLFKISYVVRLVVLKQLGLAVN